MVSNLLVALMNIEKEKLSDLNRVGVLPKSNLSAVIRANNAGDALDYYVKDAFCGTFKERNTSQKIGAYAKHFSYLGNQNNPPDMMLKGADAVEVKKTGIQSTIIALNSSYPKSKLHADSPMLTRACRECESWSTKDMIYAVGNVGAGMRLATLAFVYGDCYAASREVYERIWQSVSDGISRMDMEFSRTRELGRVKKVDAVGITDLRIRGMWQIRQPIKVFSELFKPDARHETSVFVLMREEKWKSFSNVDKHAIQDTRAVEVRDVKIRDPDNPSRMIASKLIRFGW